MPGDAPAGSARRILLVGAGGFAEEVGDMATASGFEVVAKIEGRDPSVVTRASHPPIIWVDEHTDFDPSLPIVPAIGSIERRELIERLMIEGRSLVTVKHPSVVIGSTSVIEDGCVLFPGTTIGTASRLGMGTIVCRGAQIGHHTTFGVHSFLGPGANVAGFVVAGEQVTIGLGANIRDHISIGVGAFVAIGSVVVADVPASTTVAGNPARPFRHTGSGLEGSFRPAHRPDRPDYP